MPEPEENLTGKVKDLSLDMVKQSAAKAKDEVVDTLSEPMVEAVEVITQQVTGLAGVYLKKVQRAGRGFIDGFTQADPDEKDGE